MSRAVPYLEHGAIIHGRAATGVAWLLDRAVNRGDLAGLPETVREDTLLAVEACRLAARAWACRSAAAEFGTSAARHDDGGASSAHEVLDVTTVAELLGVGERRARDLAAGGLGKKLGGRWVFDAAAVAAEAEKRGAA